MLKNRPWSGGDKVVSKYFQQNFQQLQMNVLFWVNKIIQKKKRKNKKLMR